jgi:hypothetical protein
MPQAPQTPVMPNPAFAAGPAMPGAMPGMPTPPAMPQPPAMPTPPAGPQLTAAAHAAAPGLTFAQWLAGGWTEQAMRQTGYIV